MRPVIFATNGYEIWMWNDAATPKRPRLLAGFYSQDSLAHFQHKRQHQESLSAVNPARGIIPGRMYQTRAFERAVERFGQAPQGADRPGDRHRQDPCRRLAVRRSAPRRWAKRILFLCDRTELRKQAHNVFKEFLPGEPRTFVTAATSKDRDKRIYLATYPAMMECFEPSTSGFFDLIIADESHRSIYNRYRDLFAYFDCLQVGLTATPVEFIARNTFEHLRLRGASTRRRYFSSRRPSPTAAYLVPFEVVTHTTPFLREGIKYSEMSEEQRRAARRRGARPAAVEFDQAEGRQGRLQQGHQPVILRNLMENGIRDATGTRVGKSIIFARNHNHAVLLQNLFDEMYPQYGGNFCRVIDNYDARAEELIDDFKGEGKNPDLTIAISVDMLDTGIDVPEIVNLVFAKPVYSYVKFWQMIGRGTRLCKNLFGPGQDKTHFLIFDHWKNFEFFDQRLPSRRAEAGEVAASTVFEARVALAETALSGTSKRAAFEMAIGLIAKRHRRPAGRKHRRREKWKEVDARSTTGGLLQAVRPGHQASFSARDRPAHAVARHRRQRGGPPASTCSSAGCRPSTRRVEQLRRPEGRTMVERRSSNCRMNLSQVKAKQAGHRPRSAPTTSGTAVGRQLEDRPGRLRGVMQYRTPTRPQAPPPKVIDIKEDPSLVERKTARRQARRLEPAAYRNRVEKVLQGPVRDQRDPAADQAGEPVSRGRPGGPGLAGADAGPDLDLHDLLEYYPETAGHLDLGHPRHHRPGRRGGARAVHGLRPAAIR